MYTVSVPGFKKTTEQCPDDAEGLPVLLFTNSRRPNYLSIFIFIGMNGWI